MSDEDDSSLNHGVTTTAKVATYHATVKLLAGLYEEIKELAKKKPDATLSVAKVKLINRLLADIKALLKDERQGKYLDLLDEDALPQFSDVVLILSQFDAALKSFQSRYFYYR